MYLYVIVGKSHKASWSLCCLPPRPTTQADNLCGQQQLPLIVRQSSVEAGLYSNGSATGTPSKLRKNLIRTAPGCLLLCPPTIARKHLQDCNVWSSGADMKWGATHMKGHLAKWARQSDREKEECGNRGSACPSTCLLLLSLLNGRRPQSLKLK